MSVLIKDRDKPKSCALCFLRDDFTHYCPYEETKEKDCPIEQVSETGMSDLISRRAVLNLPRKKIRNIRGEVTEMCVDVEDIEDLPSAQHEHKKGKWMPHEDEDGEHYGDKCSECGEWYVMPYGKTNFCPNCGAKMEDE